MVASLNIFIDGSWLYRVQAPNSVLAERMERPENGVHIAFERLDAALLAHGARHDAQCTQLGDRYLSTSVFTLPADFDTWPMLYPGILPEQVEQTKRNTYSRNRFVQSALDAGYKPDAVFRPTIKRWILEKLIRKEYQEKQVDTTVVALLVSGLRDVIATHRSRNSVA